MKVYLSELAEQKLLELNLYLLENWGKRIRDKFLEKLSAKIEQITNQPESCPQSIKFRGIYKCVVTKQTTFYYRILSEKNEIEIITFFDTRQAPEKLRNNIE